MREFVKIEPKQLIHFQIFKSSNFQINKMKDFPYTESKDTRSGFGAGLLELGRSNPNVSWPLR